MHCQNLHLRNTRAEITNSRGNGIHRIFHIKCQHKTKTTKENKLNYIETFRNNQLTLRRLIARLVYGTLKTQSVAERAGRKKHASFLLEIYHIFEKQPPAKFDAYQAQTFTQKRRNIQQPESILLNCDQKIRFPLVRKPQQLSPFPTLATMTEKCKGGASREWINKTMKIKDSSHFAKKIEAPLKNKNAKNGTEVSKHEIKRK
ncbi:hypothetical protein TcasGA2_TC012888 [Tribolium castaneum]|uniref:Uncharacterized protein n=1 Tax=Tribolium castaneum TaxID=7070 RepID=D7EJ15_TRICA|nr:hypothetical protein TcasGA2_TC012888 [Tribolium castaneum]